jgi:hypothetical protein
MAWRQALAAYGKLAAPTAAQHRRVGEVLQEVPSVMEALQGCFRRDGTWAEAARAVVSADAAALRPFALEPLFRSAQVSGSWLGAAELLAAYRSQHPAALRLRYVTSLLRLENEHNPRLAGQHDASRIAEIAAFAADVCTVDRDATESEKFRNVAVRLALENSSACRERHVAVYWESALTALAAAFPEQPICATEATHLMVLHQRRQQWVAALAVCGLWATARQSRHHHGNERTEILLGVALDAIGRRDYASRAVYDVYGEDAAVRWAVEQAANSVTGFAPALLHRLAATGQWGAGLAVLRAASLPPRSGGNAATATARGDLRSALNTMPRGVDGGNIAPWPPPPSVRAFASAIDAEGPWAGALHVVATMRSCCGPRRSLHWRSYADAYPTLSRYYVQGSTANPERETLGGHVQQLLLRLGKCASRSAGRGKPPPAAVGDAVMALLAKHETVLRNSNRL